MAVVCDFHSCFFLTWHLQRKNSSATWPRFVDITLFIPNAPTPYDHIPYVPYGQDLFYRTKKHYLQNFNNNGRQLTSL